MKFNKDCNSCEKLNIRTDDKGYVFGYECLKHNDTILHEDLNNIKYFN